MRTVDIHTHLLNPGVRFSRFYDRLAIRFFAERFGISPAALLRNPYETFLQAMIGAVRGSRYVEKICLFPVDSRLDEQGRETDRDRTVCSCTEDVLAVFRNYPEEVVPFLSINPRRRNALDLLDEYIEAGCKGAKFLQNYWGVDLNDQKFLPYFEKLRERSIPLVIHIGSEYSIDSFAPCERIGMLRAPLEAGVTVIAAHMGLGRFRYKPFVWRNFTINPDYFDADYFTLLKLLEEYDHLYADISAILAPMRARALRHLAGQTRVHGKLLFGTDYPVPFTTRWNTYDLPRQARKVISRIANPFDRYAAAILEYFPADSPIYTNYRKVLAI